MLKYSNRWLWVGLPALWLLLYNQSFWRALYLAIEPAQPQQWLFMLSLTLVFFLLLVMLVALLTWPYLAKAVLSVLGIGAALVAYFMHAYGITLDSSMVQNIAETDWSEAQGLVNPKLLSYLFGLGIMPAWLLYRSQLRYQSLVRECFARIGLILVSLVAIVALVMPFSADYASFFRNHKAVRQQANPLSLLYAGGKYLSLKAQASRSLERVGQDARLGVRAQQQTKPSLLVLVVGETARAENFGLNGYSRNTTPLLSQQQLFYYSNVFSCGTSTAVSVPCMFSGLGRAEYQQDEVLWRENLLDVVQHAGISVLWRDNNSGCKGVCQRVAVEDLSQTKSADCDQGECYDQVLLSGLSTKLTGKSQLIVLHQQGSHGPEYFRRYPADQTYYSPVCASNQLQDCSREQVVNAYDNSIRYTDRFLNQTIDWLKSQSGHYNTSLIYVSDHGESLGEQGLYLHGMPYSLAPDTQKHVPFIAWFSESMLAENALNPDCLKSQRAQPFSHDHLFHTVLGLLDVQTQALVPALDMFTGCRAVQTKIATQ